MKLTSRIAFATFAGALALFGMVGCGFGGHEVIGTTETCTSCHGEEPEQWEYEELGITVDAQEVGTTITVTTKKDVVYVSTPVFTKTDGSYYVCRAKSKKSVSDGSVTLELEEGLWAISGDTNSGAILVNVTEGGAEAEISL